MARKPRVAYSETLSASICERLAQGQSLLSITKEFDIPYMTAVNWERDYPDHQVNSRRAREIGCHYLAEEAKLIADTPRLGELVEEVRGPGKNGRIRERKVKQADMVEHRRLQIDTRLRLIGKWLPKVYGDKQQLEHSGEVTISERLARAEAKRKGEA